MVSLVFALGLVAGAVASASANFSDLGPESLSLSADGRFAAYDKIVNPKSPQSVEDLWVLDLVTGKASKIDERKSADKNGFASFMEPVWSPDGTKLAYFIVHHGEEHLHVWNRLTNSQIYESVAQKAHLPSAPWWPAQWSSDSKNVFFVGASRLSNTQVLDIDLDTRKEKPLASGLPFVGVRVSRHGFHAIAIVSESTGRNAPESRFGIYQLPLHLGETFRMLVHGIPQYGPGRALSLSPSGNFLAYTTGGRDGTGDVHILNVSTGSLKNVTADLKLINWMDYYEDGRRKNYADGKFGSSYIAPIWSSDEKAVFVTHPIQRLHGQSPIHMQIWRIARNGRSAYPISLPNISVVAFAQCVDTGFPCMVGNQHEVVAVVRLERSLPQSDVIAIAAIDLAGRHVHILQRIGLAHPPDPDGNGAVEADLGTVYRTIVVASHSHVIVSREETDTHPAELWKLNILGGSPQSLGVLNRDPVPRIGKHLDVVWASKDGESLSGSLRLPANIKKTDKPECVNRFEATGI